jgi:hypothetical protein
MSRTRLAVIAVAVILAAGLGVGLGVGLGGSSGQSLTQAGTAQLASVQLGCQRWLGATPSQPGTSQLCGEMTEWMSHYMVLHGTGPEMMWGDPSRLASSCEQWITKNPPAAITALNGWCRSMVVWMTGHVGSWSSRDNWSDWMMHGSMMGG